MERDAGVEQRLAELRAAKDAPRARAAKAKPKELKPERPEDWSQQFPEQPPRRPAQPDPVPWIRCLPWGWSCRCGCVALGVVTMYESDCEHCGGVRLRPHWYLPFGWFEKHLGCGRQ